MANEITVSAQLSATKGTLSVKPVQPNFQATMTGSGVYAGGSVSIGTATHEAIPLGDVSTARWSRFKNLDATNFVQVGTDASGTFVPFVKLLAGEACVVPMATSAPYAQADTAAVNLEYLILPN